MQVPIINIGKTKVIQLESSIVEKYNIKDNLELILENDGIKLIPISNSRANWESEFEEMHKNGDDTLHFDSIYEDDKWG